LSDFVFVPKSDHLAHISTLGFSGEILFSLTFNVFKPAAKSFFDQLSNGRKVYLVRPSYQQRNIARTFFKKVQRMQQYIVLFNV